MKLFSKIQYRHKVATVIFLFILLPFLLLSLVIVKNSWDDKVESILEQNKSELRIGVETINTLFLSSLQKLTFINNNSAAVSYFEQGEFDDFVDNMKVYDNIKKIIDALVIDSPDINFVIYPENKSVYSGNYIEKMERLKMQFGKDEPVMMQKLLSLDWDENLWRYEKVEHVGGVKNSEEGKEYIRCYKKMQAFDQTLAITQMSISISKVLKCLEGEFPYGSFIAFKPDDHTMPIIMEEHSSMEVKGWIAASPEVKLTNEKYYPIQMKLNYSSGTVTLFIPRTLMLKDLRSFLLIRLFIVLMSISTLFFIVEVASYLITKRLTKLIDRINVNFENTKIWSAMDRQSQEDDLGKLENKFYDMLEKVRDSYKRTMEYENDKKTFELELLQSRINPHFLYNTLSTMKWNCNSEKMAGIIDTMVLYYRMALNNGDMIVKISHEMKLVEEYLKIQKYTYESDFTYIFEADENVKDFLTIRHLLQPIVENAVLHGINGLESGGVIRISVKSTGEAITLSVSDNGVGMSEETVNKLLYGEYKSKIGGYGIKNVQKRLNLFYGPNTSLQITSSRGKGTTTLITIPTTYLNNDIITY